MVVIKRPKTEINQSLQISGSKSESNRILILQQTAGWPGSYKNLSGSDDTRMLVEALQQINSKSNKQFDIRHAGTDMRFLTALLSVTPGTWTITGSERMKERPIKELVNSLRTIGAEIEYLEQEGYPPLRITGQTLKGGSMNIDSSISSQFITAMMLVSPRLEEGLFIKLGGKMISRPYLEMTAHLLRKVGMNLRWEGDEITIKGKKDSSDHNEQVIESDWSSASYLYAVCALAGNATIELKHFNQLSYQADSVLPEIYYHLGVKTSHHNTTLVLTKKNVTAKVFDYDFTDCPDIAQTVAVTCFGLNIGCRLTGLSSLKVKETDRIIALKTELEKIGAKVSITNDTLSISTASKNYKANLQINTYNDHRMAMSFAPLALIYESVQIDDANVVDKSYPAFWNDLVSLGFSVNLQP